MSVGPENRRRIAWSAAALSLALGGGTARADRDGRADRSLGFDAPLRQPTEAAAAAAAGESDTALAQGPASARATPTTTGASTAATATSTPRTNAPIRLVVSMVWEGRDLQPHNLEAIRAFRARFPQVPLVHFVSPAYFTRPGADAAATRTALRSAMRPDDKIGLTIGAWRSLARAAGVIFRSSPTFWGRELRDADCEVDCGVEVPVNVYPQAEITALVRTSLDTLAGQGFGRLAAATTTGWVASPQVLEAYAQNGIRYDFSAVAPELVRRRLAGFPIYQWVRGLWSAITPHTQPFVVPSVQSGTLMALPQSLAAVDYLEPKDVAAIFDEYADRLQREPNRDLTFQLVAYQETARQSLPRFTAALQAVLTRAERRGIVLQPPEIPDMRVQAGDTVAH